MSLYIVSLEHEHNVITLFRKGEIQPVVFQLMENDVKKRHFSLLNHHMMKRCRAETSTEVCTDQKWLEHQHSARMFLLVLDCIISSADCKPFSWLTSNI